jgi:hypothetical protein
MQGDLFHKEKNKVIIALGEKNITDRFIKLLNVRAEGKIKMMQFFLPILHLNNHRKLGNIWRGGEHRI